MKKLYKICILIFLIISILIGNIGCTKALTSDELERIHGGLLYHMDEELLNMDYFIQTVEELSSEKYLGRGIGADGNKLAVNYIKELFQEVGLNSPDGISDYIQEYPLYPGSKLTSSNVIGIIPGNKDEEEIIILSAHLDHLGGTKQQFYPGALDNASGVGCLVEIANFINQNKIRPNKTIVFIAFNGEETGFTGSKYYAKNPIYPLEKTVLINLDQIGSKVILPLYILSIDNQGELKDDIFKYSQELNLDAKTYINSRSDHVPFEAEGVDAISIVHPFDRSHGYHTPKDTIEIVSKDRAKEVVYLVLYYLDKKAYE